MPSRDVPRTWCDPAATSCHLSSSLRLAADHACHFRVAELKLSFLEFCRFARPCFGHGSPFGGLPRRARFCGGGSGFFLLR